MQGLSALRLLGWVVTYTGCDTHATQRSFLLLCSQIISALNHFPIIAMIWESRGQKYTKSTKEGEGVSYLQLNQNDTTNLWSRCKKSMPLQKWHVISFPSDRGFNPSYKVIVEPLSRGIDVTCHVGSSGLLGRLEWVKEEERSENLIWDWRRQRCVVCKAEWTCLAECLGIWGEQTVFCYKIV